MGRLSVIPATASIRFSVSPPQYSTATGCSPGTPGIPRSNTSVARNTATANMISRRALTSEV